MRMSQLLGKTRKENPREAELASHRLLTRAGYAKQYSAGVYGLMPLAFRSLQKIENIVREEMDQVDGQEVRFPCLMTKELWETSGRYESIGPEMFRLADRSDQGMLLGMTHEEAAVFMASAEVTSYKNFPGMIYQVQTKFRDEPRARGGLIRLREFTMKDAYSYHRDEACLKNTYDKVHKAYEKIFARTGCQNVASVLSDNGMFGGRYSHEFMLITEAGEDTLIGCTSCQYRANQEIATTSITPREEEPLPLTEVATPGIKTIKDLANFLKVSPDRTTKVVMYQAADSRLILAFVRGDRELVEAKLRTLIGQPISPASPELIRSCNAVPGSAGPVGVDLDQTIIVLDRTALESSNTIVGANKDGVHLKNFQFKRDFLDTLAKDDQERVIIGDLLQVTAEDSCPECGEALEETRGIEIGNIFHLSDRYSKSMGWTYLDENGKQQTPIMGCYGLGISRLLPAIVEESHDEKGMVLPITVAPYELHLVALNYHKDDEVRDAADRLYQDLKKAGLEVLFDERKTNAGPQFADADLIGIPLRITVAKRSLKEGVVELKYREQGREGRNLPIENASIEMSQLVEKEYARYKKDETEF